MHLLRICIHRPGDTADELLTILAERRAATVVGHGPDVRGLLTREADRRKTLIEIERDLDEIARALKLEDWRDTVGLD